MRALSGRFRDFLRSEWEKGVVRCNCCGREASGPISDPEDITCGECGASFAAGMGPPDNFGEMEHDKEVEDIMANTTNVRPVVCLDPSYDLYAGGFCTCRRCCDAFADAFEAALREISPECGLIVAPYNSSTEADKLRRGGWTKEDQEAAQKADLWQRTHDALSGWNPTHIARLDAEGDVAVDGIRVFLGNKVPAGWEVLSTQEWSSSDFNTVDEETGTYAYRNSEGLVCPGKSP